MIHGLAPERTYQFRVRAKNIHGSSEPSCPSDPLFFLPPPAATDRKDKAVVVDRQQQEDIADSDDGQVVEDDAEFQLNTAPQFEYCHVQVQPGEPNFLVRDSHLFFFCFFFCFVF